MEHLGRSSDLFWIVKVNLAKGIYNKNVPVYCPLSTETFRKRSTVLMFRFIGGYQGKPCERDLQYRFLILFNVAKEDLVKLNHCTAVPNYSVLPSELLWKDFNFQQFHFILNCQNTTFNTTLWYKWSLWFFVTRELLWKWFNLPMFYFIPGCEGKPCERQQLSSCTHVFSFAKGNLAKWNNFIDFPFYSEVSSEPLWKGFNVRRFHLIQNCQDNTRITKPSYKESLSLFVTRELLWEWLVLLMCYFILGCEEKPCERDI